jgi:FkbM family methyltransferase
VYFGARDSIRLRFPRTLALYKRYVGPLIARDRRHIELSDWAERGRAIVARTGMHGIRFERDGIWIDDRVGHLWAYTPGLFMSALGAEFGVRYEQREIELLAERLRPGSVLVDIGANVGLHSIQLAKLVPQLTVVAFEPVGHTFAALQRNIAKNGVEAQVRPVHLALSDEPGTLRLTNQLQLGNFVVPEGQPAASGVTEEVEAKRLDNLQDILPPRIDAIKCDVEGVETSVLRGARAILERDRPLLMLEIDDRLASRYGHSGAELVRYLSELGYGYERIVGDELLPPSDSLASDLSEGHNFIFSAPPSHAVSAGG